MQYVEKQCLYFLVGKTREEEEEEEGRWKRYSKEIADKNSCLVIYCGYRLADHL